MRSRADDFVKVVAIYGEPNFRNGSHADLTAKKAMFCFGPETRPSTPRRARKRDSARRTMGMGLTTSSLVDLNACRKNSALAPLPPIFGQCSRNRLPIDNLLWRKC